MMPRSPTVRPRPGRLWRRHHLAGVSLAATLALGGLAQPSAAETALPASGHAQVIAQAVVDLPDDSLVWSVSTIDVGELPTDIAGDGLPGFVLGTGGAVVVRDAAGTRTRLAGGEALTLWPDDALTIQAVGANPASIVLLTLDRAGGDDLGAAIDAGETFPSPGGSRDVDLVGDVLAADETARIAEGDAPIFVLVTGGSIAIEADDGPQTMDAGDIALMTGPFAVTGAAEDPSRFVAAVIGADIDAPADAVSGVLSLQTASQSSPPGPAPSAPSPSPTPDPPTPTPAPPTPTPVPQGEGPEDDPDDDFLVNAGEDAAGTDRHDPDTDDDGASDGIEVVYYQSSPTTYDTDGDGFGDFEEIDHVGSNPILADSDGDGLTDYDDFGLGTGPMKYDTDGDGLGDGDEHLTHRTDPLKYDTDGDGVGDGDEIASGTDPFNPDTDNDGLKESEEAFLGTDPRNADTDGDGYSDGTEVYVHRTYPLDPESHP